MFVILSYLTREKMYYMCISSETRVIVGFCYFMSKNPSCCFTISLVLALIFPSSPSVLLGFELRDSCLLGRHPTTEAIPPAFFCFGYFWGRVSLYAQASVDCDPTSFVSLHSWDDRHAPPCPSFSVQMGPDGLSPPHPGWPQTVILPNSASRLARIIGLSH
jgi:hypothetical protein